MKPKQYATRLLGKRGACLLRDTRDFLASLFGQAPPVLVYQMGKVGSQSIYYSLKSAGYFPILHFHYLAHLRKQDKYDYLYFKYLHKYGKRMKVVRLTREPVARNLSAFAHDFNGYFGGKMQDHSLTELGALFLEYDRHQQGVNWFDDEFYKTLNVDVYEYPFDKELGFGHIVEQNLEILILKLEISDQKKEMAISDSLDLHNFRLERRNTATERSYKGNYREFVSNIQLPRSDVETLYSSKFFKHFYSNEERSAFEQKWFRYETA